MNTLRVLVADDHRLMLAAVRRALADAEDIEIVGEVSVGSQVVPAVARDEAKRRAARHADARARRSCLPRAAPRARSHHRSRDPLELQRPGADRGRAEGGCARLHRQDGRARRSRGGPPECAHERLVRGLGGGGAGRILRSPERPPSASAKEPYSRRWHVDTRIGRSVASSGSASRPSSSTCATSIGSSRSRAEPKRLGLPIARASSGRSRSNRRSASRG